MPKGSKAFWQIKKFCLQCDKPLVLNNNREIKRKNFCCRKCSSLFNYHKCKLGGKPTQEQIVKQSESLKIHWQTNKHPMKGKRHSLESRKRNAESQKKRAKEHPESYLRGPKHQSWKGKKCKYGKYIHVYQPKHPKADMRGRVLEHVLVIEKYLGHYLEGKEVVHHINEIKDDNRLENLRLFSSQSKHMKFHWEKKKLKYVS